MIHGMSDEGGRMKTDHMTHLVMSVNDSPLGLWVPHSVQVQEARAFDMPYSLPYPQYLRAHSWVTDPLSAVSRDGYLAITVRGLAHCLA